MKINESKSINEQKNVQKQIEIFYSKVAFNLSECWKFSIIDFDSIKYFVE